MSRLIAFAFMNLLGAISPGPDFAIVTRFGLMGSRRAALLASLGIALALFVHVGYCLCGISWVLEKYPIMFTGIQVFGALYLGYVGFQLIRSQDEELKMEKLNQSALRTGFLTNLLNPKASIFLLSLFIQFVEPSDSFAMKTAFALTVPLVAFLWFSFLSILLTRASFLSVLKRFQRRITFCMGVALIGLSFMVLWHLKVL